MEKGENARNEHFPFLTMFSYIPGTVNITLKLFTTQARLLTTLYNKPFENIVGKGENAGNQHFLLFPQCFLPFPKQVSFFSVTFILSSANAFNLDQSKILSFGKETHKFEGQNFIVG